MERTVEGHRVKDNVIILGRDTPSGYIDTNDRIIRSSSADITPDKHVSFLRRLVTLNAGLQVLSVMHKEKLQPHEFLRLSKSWDKVSMGGGEVHLFSGEDDESFLGLVKEGVRVIRQSVRSGNCFTDYDTYIGKHPNLRTAWKLINLGEDLTSITAILESKLAQRNVAA